MTVDVKSKLLQAALVVSAPAFICIGESLRISRTLRYANGTNASGQRVVVSHAVDATTTTLGTATTTPNGAYSIPETPSRFAPTSYVVTYQGDTHRASGSALVDVKDKLGSTLTLTVPASTPAGTRSPAHGQVDAQRLLDRRGCEPHGDLDAQHGHGGAPAGRRRRRPAPARSTTWPHPPVRRPTPSGTPATPRTSGEITGSTALTLNPTDLTLGATVGKRRLATVTAYLGATVVPANRVVTITAQPQGGTAPVIATGLVDASGI